MNPLDTAEIGKTGLKVSRLGLGGAPFGGLLADVAEQRATESIKKGLDLGVTYFDTAPLYGSGKSETLLAQALKGKRDQVIIASKVGYDFYTHKERIRHEEKPQKFDPQYIRFALEQSLQRLQTDVIDLGTGMHFGP